MKLRSNELIRPGTLVPTLMATWLLGSLPLAGSVAYAQDADNADDELAEIVVVGKRASILKSLEEKRSATSIVDSIASEELGRFPDPNVADSLSHVPGVTVRRTRNGEAQYVNIRGLGPEFSVVTLNNRILATDDEGRNFAFDVIPSEMISGADVWKSPEAKRTEGSIGGTIDLKSTRPLSVPGLHSSLTATGEYNSLSENTGTKFTGIFSNTFADDSLGVIVGATYSKGDRRADDMIDNFYFGTTSGLQYDLDGNGTISPNEENVIGPGSYALGTYLEDYERTGITSTLQWKPSDRFQLTADALYTRLEGDSVGYTESFFMVPFPGRWSNIVMDGNVVTAVDVSDVTMEVVTLDEHRTVDTSMFGLNGVFDVSDRLVIKGDAYWSESVRDGAGKNTFVVAGSPGAHSGHFELNEGGLPDYIPNWTGGRSSADFGNDDFAPHWAARFGDDIKDEVVGLKLDANFALDFSMAEDSSVDFGVAYTGRNKTKNSVDNFAAGACNYCGYPYFFGDVGADVVRPFPVDDLFGDEGANVPRNFPIFDIPGYAAGLAASDGQTLTDYAGNTRTFGANESAVWAPVANPVNSYDIEENTTAAFAQLNLSDERWFANVGVRYIDTEATSKYSYDEIVSITVVDPNVPNPQWIVIRSGSTAQEAKGSYDKVLPAANLGIYLKEDLLLRLSAAQTMSRPTLTQMAPLTTDNAVSGLFTMNVSGDPGIKPVFADQADASLEWYFDDDSLLSAAVFWKSLEGFITTQTTTETIAGQDFQVTRPINGDTAEVRGVELGAKTFFDNGFGVTASYTYTDTSTKVNGVDTGGLVNVPDTAYSVALIYEKGRISSHVALEYTGEAVADPYSPLGDAFNTTREDYSMVTASFRFRVLENLTAFVEGFNLLDEANLVFAGRGDLPRSIQYGGRTINFGAVYTF